jgi:hypothetical protein
VILCHFNKVGFNVFGYAGSDFFGLCGHWVAFGCSKWGGMGAKQDTRRRGLFPIVAQLGLRKPILP